MTDIYLLSIINKIKSQIDEDDISIEDLYIHLDEESIEDESNITITQAIGILAHQDHFLRKLVTAELLKETHMSVSEFCTKNDIVMNFGEIIGVSKSCKKESEKQNIEIKTKLNHQKKTVSLFEVSVLKKIMRL